MLIGLVLLTFAGAIWITAVPLLRGAALDEIGKSCSMLLSLGFAVSLFALAGWVVCILPLTIWPATRAWLGHRKWTECHWMFMGVVAYGLLVVIWVGPAAWYAVWLPVLVGLFAGRTYRWLIRGKAAS